MNRGITALAAITCLAVSALQAAEEPTRILYFGNSLTDQLKYDHFQKLAADDDGNGRDSQVVWQGTAENTSRPNRFGTLILESRE